MQWLTAFILFFILSTPVWAQNNKNTVKELTNGYTQTHHPIVLVHGMAGFANIGSIDYFFGIPRALRKDGANVHVASVSSLNSTEVRGEQLLKQVKQIVAITGANKVNLIGHSHGGPTARYVASVRPDLVASVTSIAGSNKGTPMGDMLVQAMSQNNTSSVVLKKSLNDLGGVISVLSGRPELPQNALAGAH